ncbi:MAG TPA: ABC transporter substrate-binding protein [Bauldia sp.]|nr:ABC transporter substrate-binding protein [Bauldia sp.]
MKRTLYYAAAAVLALGMAAGANAKTLTYCAEASPEGFDPALYEGGNTLDAVLPVYEGLVKFKPGTTEVIPALAEKWEISPDGLTYTFHLRHGVKFGATDYFTPTRDFNADDVVFSFHRQMDANTPWNPEAPNAVYQYWGDMSMPDQVVDMAKVDDYTVKLTLKQPSAPMLANLAMTFASIVSKEYADKLQAANQTANMDQQPVGTGPFVFVGYNKDADIHYKANPDYWGDKAKIDNLVFAITTDAATRLQKLKAGECDVMVSPNPADVAGIKADPNLATQEQQGLNIGALMYNTQQKPFDNPDVRHALNMAIDKKAIIDAVLQGLGQAAINPIPPTMWGYNKDVQDDPYDPAAAKAALAKAGVKDLHMKIWAMPVARPYMPDAKTAATIIQKNFADVGVTADIFSEDWKQYLADSSPHTHDGAVIMGWTGDNGDPDNFLTPNLGCNAVDHGNRSEWCNKDFDDLIRKAAIETDQAKRAAMYEQAQVIFKKDAPWATLDHSVVVMAMSKKVQNYVIDPFGLHHFEQVGLAD